MNVTGKFRTLFFIIKIYGYSTLLLLAVIMASAFSETLGVGMVMPLLEVIINQDETSSGSVQYLYPLLRYFPPSYRLMVIGGLFVFLTLVKNILFILKTDQIWKRGARG